MGNSDSVAGQLSYERADRLLSRFAPTMNQSSGLACYIGTYSTFFAEAQIRRK